MPDKRCSQCISPAILSRVNHSNFAYRRCVCVAFIVLTNVKLNQYHKRFDNERTHVHGQYLQLTRKVGLHTGNQVGPVTDDEPLNEPRS